MTYITLANLIQFPKKNKKHSKWNVNFSRVEVPVDGVNESDTCSYTLPLFIPLSFPGCLRPYVWKVVWHLNQLRPFNEMICGKYIVDELLSSNFKLLCLACNGKEKKHGKVLDHMRRIFCLWLLRGLRKPNSRSADKKVASFKLRRYLVI